MSRILKVAINRHIINKIEKNNRKLFGILTRECVNVGITLPELAGIIDQGHPFCAQHKDSRKNENFICSDVLAVDIDDGMTLSEALANQYVQEYGGFIYTTPSHMPEHHRFRIVFELERTISDPAEMTAAYQGVIRKFGGDQSCKDACRAFYGSKGSEPIMLGKVLSNDQLGQLIALGRDAASIPDKISTGEGKNYSIVARRSDVAISPDHPVTQANGQTVAFEVVPFGADIHCPVHLDRNPSAFVVESKKGEKGVYCHKCAATFWMKSRFSNKADNYDFYRTEAIIREQEYYEDPANTDDYDEAPAGLLEMEQAQRSCHTFAHQFLNANDIPLKDGVTFIRSGKGTGKSELLVKLVARCVALGKSVLLVGHRKTLSQTMAERLGLVCYFYSDNGAIRNNKPTNYYAICIDSIFKLLKPTHDKYDVVIIDESEQVFSHLTGSTLKDKRRACYMQLFHYLDAAKSVIVADADLGPVTIEALSQAIRMDTPYHFYLNDYRQNQRDFHHYGSDTHLMLDMLRAIGEGGRHYITTNSRTKAEELREAIQQLLGDAPKIMLVTSKTTSTKEVQEFINNIKTEILKYNVVIASPTLGTGIDITFENESQHIDTVFGFFVTRVNTHFDIDQQLARVRHPKAIKVWVSPEQFTFETEPEVILREVEFNGALNDAIIGYHNDGSANLDKTYLNVYAHVVGMARASKNNLRKNLLDLRTRNGWNVIYVDVDAKEAEAGKVVKEIAKAAVEQNRINDICVAVQLTSEDYDILNACASPLGKAEDDAMRRYEVEKFYREDVSSNLLTLDNKGTYRRQLGLLEIYLSSTNDLVTKDSRDSELATILSDRKNRALKQLMLKALFTTAGLADNHIQIKHDAVITSDDLNLFIQTCEENSTRIQDQFGVSLRKDLHKRPMMQLGEILKLVGLSLQKISSKTVSKKKINYYRIQPEEWKNTMHYIERRMPKHEHFMKYLTM